MPRAPMNARSACRLLLPLFALGLALCFSLSACCSKKKSRPPVNPVNLLRIDVTPVEAAIHVGEVQRYTATGLYDDETTKDVTAEVAWTSSDSLVAEVGVVETGSTGESGPMRVAIGRAPGQVIITAVKEDLSDSASLTVEPPALMAIDVTPAQASIAMGRTQQFTATGRFTDGATEDLTATASWASSNAAMGSLSNEEGSKGLATAVAAGQVTVTATFEDLSGSAALTVTEPVLISVQVTPANPSIALGTKQQFTATGIYDNETSRDLTAEAEWTTSEAAIAPISNEAPTKGLATGAAVGSTQIAAAVGAQSGSTTLTVTLAVLDTISVTPPEATIAKGTTQQFAATGRFTDATTQDLTAQAVWTSSAEATATVSDAEGSKGLAAGVAAGTATITASFGSKAGTALLHVTPAALVSIAVTPTNPGIVAGTTQQFTATGTYSDATTQDVTAQAAWTSSATLVATVGNAAGSKGLGTGIAAGSATITAAIGAVSGSTVLDVTQANLDSITVTPAEPSVPLGRTQQFTAKGNYSNGTSQDITAQALWTSSNGSAATVSNAAGSKGLASTVALGSTTIGAAFEGVTGTTTMTVTPGVLATIAVTPADPSVPLGRTQQFAAVGGFTDGAIRDVTTDATWTSSATAVATVSNAAGSKGLASAAAAGKTAIQAAIGAVSGSTQMTVTVAVPISIVVTPADPAISAGATQQFAAQGTFSDSSTRDLTADVTWDSSKENVAAVSNAAGSKGLATGVAPGVTTIGAALNQVRGTATLTVNPARPGFRRCDANQDAQNNIADGVWIVSELFHGGPRSLCLDASDCNDDGVLTLTDALYCFNWQLRAGPAPSAPYPACGTDPAAGTSMGCESFQACK